MTIIGPKNTKVQKHIGELSIGEMFLWNGEIYQKTIVHGQETCNAINVRNGQILNFNIAIVVTIVVATLTWEYAK